VRRVVVVGAGVAGTAAALGAARAGARVVLVDGGTGASTLATGALDAVPWNTAGAQRTPLAPELAPVLEALGGYALPDAGALLTTMAGIVRPARGHDAALLDVQLLSRGRGAERIGVVRCDRPGWDADALACAWGDGFEPVDATMLRHADERVVPDADFAARHDDPARLGWLADRLRETLARAGGRVEALVLPPSLGVERARAASLAESLGVPCGEALGSPGGPSGLRFEQARVRARAAAVVGARVMTDEGQPLEADAVVLATGGLLGGGIEYAPSESMLASALPPHARIAFRLTIEAPVVLGAHGRPLHLPGTLFGVAPESLSWPFAHDPMTDAVGVLADAHGRAAEGVYAAGEIVADAPRTWLAALAAGARAGAAAAAHATAAVTSSAARSESPGAASPSRP
jgi:glycerol-3-phosphate dehydrogenase subunit B